MVVACVYRSWRRWWEDLSDIEGGKDMVKPNAWEKKFLRCVVGAGRGGGGELKRPCTPETE